MGSESDGQQFLIPLVLILCFTLYAGYFTLENPDSTLAQFYFFFPFTAPVVAMVKLAIGFADGESYQLFISLFVLIISGILVLFMAARLFKNGLLNFGHTIRMRTILQWLKK
jgi:ABC-2 type transport system permease protein